MNTNRIRILSACIVAALAVGAEAAGERWFGESLADRGRSVYQAHCAECHREDGAGDANWQQRGPDGAYPAPPLDGTGHTWHHDLSALQRQIREGGEKLGGVMPAFSGQLGDAEIAAVLAYVQSLWPDDIYAAWTKSYPDDAATGIPVADDAQGAGGNPVTARLRSLLSPGTRIGEPEDTPVAGIYAVRAGSRYLYVDESGRYLFTGELMDLEARESLTDKRMGSIRLEALAGFAQEDMVVYPADGEEKAVLRVFTDTTCPFCRRLHQEVPALQAAGVTVRYLPFPRSGPDGPGAEEMRSVWCETDRAAAMTEAKSGDGYIVGDTGCENAGAVAEGYRLGVEVGVTGTPAIILPDGRMIAGYQPYRNLLRTLGIN